MSAYMVEDETINRVVEWLYWEVTTDPFLKEQLENPDYSSGLAW